MLLLLDQEVLHTDAVQTYYRTYDTARDLYGVHSSATGMVLEPLYLHVYAYEKGCFIVVDQMEDYHGIDTKGSRVDLSRQERRRWYSIIIKSMTCPCVQTRTKLTCTYCCGDGNLYSTYGLKQLSNLF